MADRIPLIVDSSSQQVKELPAGDSLILSDNEKVILGTGSDLQIYHDGSNSRIQEGGTGSLLIRGTNLQLQDSDGYDYLTCTDGGSGGTVALKHLGTTVLSTTSTGIDVTGVITTDGLTTSADINFGDSDEAVFGASSDFKIFHSGGENFIRGNSSASATYIDTCENLNIRHLDTDGSNAETMIKAVGDGAVELYHDNSKKLETTSTGVTVTGALLEDTNRVATNGRAIAFSLIFG